MTMPIMASALMLIFIATSSQVRMLNSSFGLISETLERSKKRWLFENSLLVPESFDW